MLTFFRHFPLLFVKIWDAQFHKIVSDIGYFSETFRLKNAIGEVSIFTKDIIDYLTKVLLENCHATPEHVSPDI